MERRSKDEGHSHGHGRITINVGGLRHETYLTTLRNHPDTRYYYTYYYNKGKFCLLYSYIPGHKNMTVRLCEKHVSYKETNLEK